MQESHLVLVFLRYLHISRDPLPRDLPTSIMGIFLLKPISTPNMLRTEEIRSLPLETKVTWVETLILGASKTKRFFPILIQM